MQTSGGGSPGGGERRRWRRDVAPFLTLGLQLAASVVLFFFLGRWLDEQWNTSPWLMLAGLLLGTVGGFVQFFRSVSSLGKDGEHDEG